MIPIPANRLRQSGDSGKPVSRGQNADRGSTFDTSFFFGRHIHLQTALGPLGPLKAMDFFLR